LHTSPNSVLSLKSHLVIYFASVILIVGLTFSFYYYNSSSSLIIDNVGEREYLLLSNKMDSIDNELHQISSFIDWTCLNAGIKTLLQRQGEAVNVYDGVKSRVYSDIDNQYMFFTLKNWISSLYIIGDNGLTIRYGSNAYNVDVEMFENDTWYIRGADTHGETIYSHAIPNHNRIPTCLRASPAEYVIPIFKLMKYDYNDVPLGKLVIFLDSEIFIKNAGKTDPGTRSLLVDPQGFVMASSNPEAVGRNIRDESYYRHILNNADHFFIHSIDNVRQLITYKISPNTGYTLIGIQPVEAVTQQSRTVVNSGLLVLVLLVLFALLLSWYLSVNFTRPINKIAKRVNEISKGNFSGSRPDAPRAAANEIVSLEYNLLEMESGIQRLMQDSARRAEEERRLEIKMLQSQINPHFLNNTLNSIRLMAIMQGADGIVEMISSLGVILECSTRNTAEKIQIRDELSVVNSYFAIQRIRYKGKVSFHVRCEDESILRCMIVKFVLQPIVENAIFHGIEPKSSAGRIEVVLRRVQDDICITISDDGMGIDRESLSKILEFRQDGKENGALHNIGLHNVNSRLKYVYGEAYGLKIVSEKDHFTIVTITIPAEEE
jgi:two-component system sensor histidine kinase YesM